MPIPSTGKIPKYLIWLISRGRSKKDPVARDAVISILSVIRMIEVEPVKDIESIVAPFTGQWPDEDVRTLRMAASEVYRESGCKSRLSNPDLSWVTS